MKGLLNEWLGQIPPVTGVLACGLRHADQSACTRTFSPEFSEAALENAWRCVGDAFQVLKHNRLPTEQMQWAYENAMLFCALRPDGACLAVFTSKDPQAVDANGVERLFAEFQTLGAQSQ
jgi:hypothetical protein